MTMDNNMAGRNFADADIDRLFNGTVYGSGDEKIGGVGQVYLNDATGQPEWVTVKTGLFGANETFVPLKNAQVNGDDIHVPYTKDFIKGAPNVDPDKHIDENEQQALYRYYAGGENGMREGVVADHDRVADRDERVAGADLRDDRMADRDLRDDRMADRDMADRDRHVGANGEMVAHEERINVSKQQEEAGRVKLRKRVVTEQQQVTVPVEREELVVERTPVNEVVDGNARIGEGQETEEIVLHQERPVVSKETVATEKVNIGKQTVTENQVVGGEIRKEHIEVEGENVAEGRMADGHRAGNVDKDAADGRIDGHDDRSMGQKVKDKFDGNPNT